MVGKLGKEKKIMEEIKRLKEKNQLEKGRKREGTD